MRKQKLSEVWKEVELGEICLVDSGQGAPQGEEYFQGTKIFIRARDLNHLTGNIFVGDFCEGINEKAIKKYKLKKYKKGSIVFPKSGMSIMTENIAILKEDSYVVNHLAILESNTRVNTKFLFYILKRIGIKNLCLNTSYPSIRLSDIKSLKIPLPPLRTQKKIVSILEKSEQLKEKRKLSDEFTRDYLQSTFFEMFLKDSKKFDVKTFRDISTLSQGLQIAINRRRTKPFLNSQLYITIQYLNGKKLPEYIENPRKNVTCKREDVLMTRTGNTGQIVTDVEGVFHNNFFKIDYNKSLINKIYLVYYLRQNRVKKKILSRAGQSTIPDLNHGDFYNLEISLPPLELQNRFASIVKEIESIKRQQKQSKEQVDDLFNALMKKAFKGELVK